MHVFLLFRFKDGLKLIMIYLNYTVKIMILFRYRDRPVTVTPFPGSIVLYVTLPLITVTHLLRS